MSWQQGRKSKIKLPGKDQTKWHPDWHAAVKELADTYTAYRISFLDYDNSNKIFEEDVQAWLRSTKALQGARATLSSRLLNLALG